MKDFILVFTVLRSDSQDHARASLAWTHPQLTSPAEVFYFLMKLYYLFLTERLGRLENWLFICFCLASTNSFMVLCWVPNSATMKACIWYFLLYQAILGSSLTELFQKLPSNDIPIEKQHGKREPPHTHIVFFFVCVYFTLNIPIVSIPSSHSPPSPLEFIHSVICEIGIPTT